MRKDADNWQLLQELFHLAEATPEADRERVLAEKCPDEELRRRAMDIFNASGVEEAEASRRLPSPPRCSFPPARSVPTR